MSKLSKARKTMEHRRCGGDMLQGHPPHTWRAPSGIGPLGLLQALGDAYCNGEPILPEPVTDAPSPQVPPTPDDCPNVYMNGSDMIQVHVDRDRWLNVYAGAPDEVESTADGRRAFIPGIDKGKRTFTGVRVERDLPTGDQRVRPPRVVVLPADQIDGYRPTDGDENGVLLIPEELGLYPEGRPTDALRAATGGWCAPAAPLYDFAWPSTARGPAYEPVVDVDARDPSDTVARLGWNPEYAAPLLWTLHRLVDEYGTAGVLKCMGELWPDTVAPPADPPAELYVLLEQAHAIIRNQAERIAPESQERKRYLWRWCEEYEALRTREGA